MNPDKLFDYLEGRLPATERAALEQRLMSDKQLQRELAVARQIHAGMRGDSREVLLPPQPDTTEQGRKMALRVGEITVPVAVGKLDATADEVVTISSRFGGSAAKGLQDNGRINVLVDVPSNREQEFRAALESIAGKISGSSAFAEATADRPTPATIAPPVTGNSPTTADKKSFVVQIVEAPGK